MTATTLSPTGSYECRGFDTSRAQSAAGTLKYDAYNVLKSLDPTDPLAMQKAVLGEYIAHEFERPMQDCIKAQLVVFSGIKIDKLDDLEAMIARGTIRTIFSAGSLAMALKKADAKREIQRVITARHG